MSEVVLEHEITVKSYTDAAWKEVLKLYFKDFMELCWPEAYQEIDWDLGYELLEQEFLNIIKHRSNGTGITDKLIKVWRKNGNEIWVLIHIEVQAQYEGDFSERMFKYRYQIFDYYGKEIASLAILIDHSKNWRPSRYEASLWGSSIKMEYPILKILDFKDKKDMLMQSRNPFAIVILAQLAAIETAKDQKCRVISKTALTKQLFQHGWKKQQIQNLHKFLEGVLALSGEYKLEYYKQIRKIEEEQKVSYMTTPEWFGHQRGLQEGEATLLRTQLECKFKAVPNEYLTKIQNADKDILLVWGKRVLTANTLEEIFIEA